MYSSVKMHANSINSRFAACPGAALQTSAFQTLLERCGTAQSKDSALRPKPCLFHRHVESVRNFKLFCVFLYSYNLKNSLKTPALCTEMCACACICVHLYKSFPDLSSSCQILAVRSISACFPAAWKDWKHLNLKGVRCLKGDSKNVALMEPGGMQQNLSWLKN